MAKHLPSPTHSFTIPSIYDGIQLSCRVYLPKQLVSDSANASQWRVRGAVVAHPYASLGGCYDDPVVSFIGGELLDAGYVVGTFNFRGAGDSQGRTSWTAKPELADYVSFYGFMLFYLRCLNLDLASPSDKRNAAETIHLVLGGYSYGSLLASHLPGNEVVADLFKDSIQGSPARGILLTAQSICALSKDEIPRLIRSSPNRDSQSAGQEARDLLQSSSTTISYLLVSPLLPPINLFLTLFLNLSLEVDTQASGQQRHIPCPKPADQLCAHRTLAIYGDEDTFTSVSKLRKWSSELGAGPQSLFMSTEIEGAGHFWREDGVEHEARQSLREWLNRLP